ncbi:isochorismate synthase [Streptomyces rapamycinicus]|uniref:isochorismate synthase n=2 Tax=Streptomyces rapamycinicus TaxID=1226757 RepID=A0A3L8R7A0_STRRN|nr:isochorismate synthase [Streptomyces rapamycinicus]MBB4779827.1 isochorismate synthase [Streptomyces rapamycinicus]RLV75516.1 hypothetical protein D3C57_139860 [Streptomyces rapamycinicus NRRL 5491]UTP28547.1 isochorismate synthase [Streptomyces rapamycinicus NRRL 5491]
MARSQEVVDDAIDLLDNRRLFFSGPDRTLLGIEPITHHLVDSGEDITQALAAGGGIGFVAFPFQRQEPIRLAVPARTLSLEGTPDHRRLLASVPAPSAKGGEPGAYALRPSEPPEQWCGSVADAARAVRRGELRKAVLARRIQMECDTEIQPPVVLRRLAHTFPSAYLFSAFGLVGASPELLLAKRGRMVESRALAGTIRRGGDAESDRRLASWLQESHKNQEEHRVLREVVLDALTPSTTWIKANERPEMLKLANVQHLMTRVRAELKADHPPFLQLAAMLHPTPAVCGWPRDKAYEVIERLEGWDRGLYGGALGWVDAEGNGCLCVTIRCAEIHGRNATLYVGNGIVADSDPKEELAETRAKLGAILPALIAP